MSPKTGIQIALQSFGFKHGLPPSADFVFDVRCLPNPYWQPALKELTGLDAEVIAYLENIPAAQRLSLDIYHFIDSFIPYFEADNRESLTIAIGCTGGQHRSVYMVENIAKQFQLKIPHIKITHRDLSRECLTINPLSSCCQSK